MPTPQGDIISGVGAALELIAVLAQRTPKCDITSGAGTALECCILYGTRQNLYHRLITDCDITAKTRVRPARKLSHWEVIRVSLLCKFDDSRISKSSALRVFG